MIFLILCLNVLTWSLITCEPPVNSYLPPSRNGNSRPSSQYGPPGNNGGDGGTQSGRIQDPHGNYLPPGGRSSQVDTQYGPPASQGLSQQSGQRGFGSQSGAPESQNGTPNQGGFGSRGQGFGQRPESSYGPPATGFLSDGSNGNSDQGRLSAYTQGNGQSGSNGGRSGSPSASYRAPDVSNGGNGGYGQRGNGGGRGSSYDAGNSDEPAKYEFSYDVDDSQTGTKFGHSEQRDGDLATGEYNVVLPDGRKQVVEYEAGLDGYKPQIRYEGGGNGRGSGFGSGFGGGQGGGQGYSQAGPESDNHGFSEPGHGQSGSPSRYQEASSFSQADYDGNTGYSNGRPENQGGRRNKVSGQGYPESGHSENVNGGNQGYPSGAPQRGLGYPSGSQGQRGSQGDRRGGNVNGEGYPSGSPNGPRGSGY